MFIDLIDIYVEAGKGGNGSVSFRREKYVPAGGPDGGDGGNGGSVIIVADPSISTLLDFRYRRKYRAPNGEDGKKAVSSGRNGDNLYIKVPPGTLVKDKPTGKVIVDMTDQNTEFVVARGGNGGFGNTRFKNATRQAPRFAKPGLEGQKRELTLELKMVADVGLVGFPNVGKSTLLSVVSSARPKIADYHFTTLAPNLGVVGGSNGFVLADMPGLIEGAALGLGLGHEFLRHIDRTRLLIHMVDVSASEGRCPVSDFDTINRELASYSQKNIPQIVAGNKCDLISDDEYRLFKEHVESLGYAFFPISAVTKNGVQELMEYTAAELSKIPKPKPVSSEIDISVEEEKEDWFEIDVITEPKKNYDGDDEDEQDERIYHVYGPFADRLIAAVNFGEEQSVQYFQRSLKNKGVISALIKAGILEGDTVRMAHIEFEFFN